MSELQPPQLPPNGDHWSRGPTLRPPSDPASTGAASTSATKLVAAVVALAVPIVAVGAWLGLRSDGDESASATGPATDAADAPATDATGTDEDPGEPAPSDEVSGRTVDVLDLELGMCFEPGTMGEDDETLRYTVEAVGCEARHTAEVVLLRNTVVDRVEYPKDGVIDEATELCETEGKDEIDPSGQPDDLSIIYFYPTAQTWDQGDREIVCAAYSDEGLLGSVLVG